MSKNIKKQFDRAYDNFMKKFNNKNALDIEYSELEILNMEAIFSEDNDLYQYTSPKFAKAKLLYSYARFERYIDYMTRKCTELSVDEFDINRLKNEYLSLNIKELKELGYDVEKMYEETLSTANALIKTNKANFNVVEVLDENTLLSTNSTEELNQIKEMLNNVSNIKVDNKEDVKKIKKLRILIESYLYNNEEEDISSIIEEYNGLIEKYYKKRQDKLQKDNLEASLNEDGTARYQSRGFSEIALLNTKRLIEKSKESDRRIYFANTFDILKADDELASLNGMLRKNGYSNLSESNQNLYDKLCIKKTIGLIKVLRGFDHLEPITVCEKFEELLAIMPISGVSINNINYEYDKIKNAVDYYIKKQLEENNITDTEYNIHSTKIKNIYSYRQTSEYYDLENDNYDGIYYIDEDVSKKKAIEL